MSALPRAASLCKGVSWVSSLKKQRFPPQHPRGKVVGSTIFTYSTTHSICICFCFCLHAICLIRVSLGLLHTLRCLHSSLQRANIPERRTAAGCLTRLACYFQSFPQQLGEDDSLVVRAASEDSVGQRNWKRAQQTWGSAKSSWEAAELARDSICL